MCTAVGAAGIGLESRYPAQGATMYGPYGIVGAIVAVILLLLLLRLLGVI